MPKGFLAGEEWKLQAFADFDTVQTEGGDWITGTELVAAYLDRRPVPLALDAKGEPIRKGHDLYKLAYAKSFGIKPEAVSKDNRQVGKVQELALGYEGGVGAFLTFAAAYSASRLSIPARAWTRCWHEALHSAYSQARRFQDLACF